MFGIANPLLFLERLMWNRTCGFRFSKAGRRMNRPGTYSPNHLLILEPAVQEGFTLRHRGKQGIGKETNKLEDRFGEHIN